MAERAVQTVKNGLNKFKSGSVDTRTARFLYSYRSTNHFTIKSTSAEILFNMKFKTTLDIIKPFIRGEKEVKSNKNNSKIEDIENKSFALGEAIFVKNVIIHSSNRKIEVLGLKNYKEKIYDSGEFIWKRHFSQLTPRCLPVEDCNVKDKYLVNLRNQQLMNLISKIDFMNQKIISF